MKTKFKKQTHDNSPSLFPGSMVKPGPIVASGPGFLICDIAPKKTPSPRKRKESGTKA